MNIFRRLARAEGFDGPAREFPPSSNPWALAFKDKEKGIALEFRPQADITALELALLQPAFMDLIELKQIEQFFEDNQKLFAVDLRRHFQKLEAK